MSAYYPHEGRQPGGNRTPFSLTFANSNEKPPFISVMDAHINSLEDDYLWMFKERVKLEEQYADSLAKLTMRTKALDSGTDQLGFDNAKYALPTVRSAWRQIRENSEQEVEARRAFANSLKEEVIKPLMTMKATQSRISSRIAEDVKNSKDKYNDKYSELQKLHKAYFKKSADYHEFSKDLVSSGHSPSTIPSPPPRQQALSHYHTPSILTGDRGLITPQALAQEAKKGFSQLISGLRGAAGGTGGSTSIGAGMSDEWGGRGSLDENREREKLAHEKERERDRYEREKEKERGKNEADTIKIVKLKREAEEADQKYRKEIFNLESLRINMERLAQGGSNSTAEFVQDLILKLHDIFLKYSISIQATSMFSVQMGRRSEEATEQIQLARDLQSGLAALGGIRDSPSPVLYQNYYHGPSKDLIFDVSLQDYAFARGIGGDPNIIPIIVDKCIRGIEDRGLEAEGLYRISPRLSTVQTLVHKIEIDEVSFQFPRTEEIYTIAAILKLYLRRLPEPPFRWSLSERLAYSKEREDHIGNDFIVIRTKLKRMPAIHVATLRAVILHLCKVVVADNKMDAKNLSIIFSSILFGEEGQGLGRDGVKDVDIQTLMQASKDVFFEDLLIYAPIIFEDNGDIRPSSRLTPRSSPHQSHIYSPPLTQGSQFGPPQQSGLGRSNTINASAITPPNRFGLPARTRSGSVNLPPANLRFSPSGRNDFGSGFKFRRQPSFQSGTSTPDRPRETPDIDEYTTASTFTPTPTPTPPRLPPRKSSTSNSLTSIAIPTSPPAVAAESDATIPRITDPLPPLIINQPIIDRGPHNVSLHPNPPSGPNHLELSTGNLIVPTPVDSGAISPGLANLAYLSQAAEKVIEEQASTDETSDAKVLSKSSSSD